jgi:excisionase family DNA binding protein
MKISYSVAEAAEAVGLSERVIRDAIKDSKIAVRYMNTKAIIRREDLADYIDQLPSESPR